MRFVPAKSSEQQAVLSTPLRIAKSATDTPG
jgi:hypothetical protein